MVGIDEGQIFFVVCKLPETQPQVAPRPVLTLVAPSVPLGLSDLGAEALEREVVRLALEAAQVKGLDRLGLQEGGEVRMSLGFWGFFVIGAA